MDMQTSAEAVTEGSARDGDLRAAFGRLREEEPRLRIRDAAGRLGVSEAELVDAQAEGSAIRLDGDWSRLVAALPTLGEVMTLTRNDSAVHEKVGTYEKVGAHGKVGLVLGADIDLRLFYANWRYGFAVETATAQGPRRSLQFFGPDGVAVQKIYLRPESDLDAYRSLVERFRAAGPGAPLEIVAPEPKPSDRPDAEIDIDGLRRGWATLRDVHDFAGLLKTHGVGRQQAFRLAGDAWTTEIDPGAFRRAVEIAASREEEIMIFVGNRGCIQIHTGPVRTLKEVGPWFNILDPGFNLHLREDRIASAWIVRKPTVDGPITSLEIFDAEGETIAMMFGRRNPGEAERGTWRDILQMASMASMASGALEEPGGGGRA